MTIVDVKEIRTNNCPKCGEEFVEERSVTEHILEITTDTLVSKWETKIVCARRHSFDLVAKMDVSPRYVLRMPQKQRTRATYKPVATDVPCQGCGGPILPGELYTGGPTAPKHLGRCAKTRTNA